MSEPSEQLKHRFATARAAAVAAADSSSIEKSDSVVNLTKPSLYSIYNDNSDIALGKDEDEDVGLYPTTTTVDGSSVEPVGEETPLSVLLTKFTVKILILAVCSYFYNEVSTYIRNNHIKIDPNTFQPLYLTEIMLTRAFKGVRPVSFISNSSQLNYAVVLIIQGMIMGLITPIVDFAMPPEKNFRVFSSNPDPSRRNKPAVVFNEILRSLITFLGISYAIRNIEWASPLQVSVVWSLLSPSLWLLLDGTTAGLLSGVSMTIYACGFVYLFNVEVFSGYSEYQIPEMVAIWLWTSSFFFCGMIIFGKIGRALF